MSFTVRIKELWIYPIKSLTGIGVDRLLFDSLGPVNDRRWMLVDANRRFVTQRSKPELARFKWLNEKGRLAVVGLDGSIQPLPDGLPAGSAVNTHIWKDEVLAAEAEPILSRWFSKQLGQDVRLVAWSASSNRAIRDEQAQAGEQVAFADGYPLLIANQQSLDDLNSQAGLDLDSRRFRANIVISQAPANSELSAHRLSHTTGGQIALVKPCERCNVPSIDPDTALYQKNVAALIKTHCHWQGKTIFGMNGIVRGLTELTLGDTLTMT